MASPFPGMDPYLEDPAVWPGVHALFLGQIVEHLHRPLRPRYLVRYEERVYVTSEDDPGYRMIVPDVRIVERMGSRGEPPGGPAGGLAIAEPIPVAVPLDSEVREQRVCVVDARDRSIVTVIEVLSPANQVLGSAGRESFLRKRREIYASPAHWLEIDLLRDGARTTNLPGIPDSHYMVYLSRAGEARQGFVWPIRLQERLPVVAVPLRGDDADVPLDLQAVLCGVVERGSYDLDTNYRHNPIPPLAGEDARWASGLLASAGLR